ncbi:hypothetical protein, partial [Saccharothrix deserti]|uniref:hypothetical protein n=1 Tax=Saccharothrix deserti TaxID=2593674 RepID=UPI001EE3D901
MDEHVAAGAEHVALRVLAAEGVRAFPRALWRRLAPVFRWCCVPRRAGVHPGSSRHPHVARAACRP